MDTPTIVFLSILGVVIGLPLLILFIYFIKWMIYGAFFANKPQKRVIQNNFNGWLQELNNCTAVLTKDDAEYSSCANAFLGKRIAVVFNCLSKTIAAFSNEYGTTDSLTLLQEEFQKLAKKSNEKWRHTKENMQIYYNSSQAFNVLSEINNEINAFISKAVVELSGAKYNLRKYGQAVNNNNRRVFIVHGRNHIIRDETRDFLKSKNFEPIILEYEANKGQFILEKFLSAASTVSYAIILMTGDDKVKNADEIEAVRARQNVILELGYFISQIGKERIIILQDPNVENPSDINGLLYETIADDGKWKERILTELYTLGYEKIENKLAV